MYILGLTSWESGAALFEDEHLLFAVSEERLSRTKFDSAFPLRSIAWCLSQAGIEHKDISLVCYGFSAGLPEGKEGASLIGAALDVCLKDPEAGQIVKERLVNEIEFDAGKREEFRHHCARFFPQAEIYTCTHHEAHQASAFVPSPFDEALVVSADGRGDFCSTLVSKADRTQGIVPLYRAHSWESLGYFYGRVTKLCGFTPNRHEGKVTGLAAHSDGVRAKPLMEKMVRWTGEGIETQLGSYYRPFFSNYSPQLEQEAAQFSREELAGAAQRHLEEIMCALVGKHLRETGLRHVCLAGGVFSNVKLNQRIGELNECDDVFVYPAMSDGGISAGSVFAYQIAGGKAARKEFHSLHLGPALDPEQMRLLLEAHGYGVRRPADIEGEVCALLRGKQIVGLVQGRAEFGPRALGNRSILAAANDPAITKHINQRLNRDDFMPFAPAIAQELAGRCLERYNEHVISARHMTVSFNVTGEFARNSPAAVHIDQTVRPQVVMREDNPFFHGLLSRWHDENGGLCLLNTSFNKHEEPIVATEQDVANAMEEGAIDVLVFPPYVCLRESRS
jgi:carbamoyltransferase